MGLFKLLFGSNNANSKKENSSSSKPLKNHSDLKKKTEDLRRANEEWQKEFNQITTLRNKARDLEKKKQNKDALELYIKSIKLGEESKRLNLNNYVYDIERVIIIYSKNKNYELLIPFLKINIEKYPEYKDVIKWKTRLAKLENNETNLDSTLSPKDISSQVASSPTLGKTLDDFRKKMPDFNFYFDLDEGKDTLDYQHNVPFDLFKKHKELKDKFSVLIEKGKLSEKEKDLKKAIELYEKLILEEYPGPEPHERLIIIYSKLNWKEREIFAIKRALSTFENLRIKQKEYVLNLADKYGMKEKALEFIQSDKKIFYYGGAFELYNPNKTRLEKWKKRLDKLNK